jgi:hypothetical protein
MGHHVSLTCTEYIIEHHLAILEEEDGFDPNDLVGYDGKAR